MDHQIGSEHSLAEGAQNHEDVRSRKTLYGWTLLALLWIVAAIMFFEIASDVWLREGFSWDAPIMLAIHSLQAPWLDWFMKTATLAGSYGAVLVTAAVAFWLGRRRCLAALTALLVSVVGAVIINSLLKLLFARPRPEIFPPLSVEHTYSFPSGHTITAVTLYGFLAILLWRNHHHVWAILAAMMIPLVGVSRIYLGVHYPSDVLGAMALGALWLLLVMVGVAWHGHVHRSEPPARCAELI